MWVIIYGYITEPAVLYGPYEDRDEAVKAAEANIDEPWCIAEVNKFP